MSVPRKAHILWLLSILATAACVAAAEPQAAPDQAQAAAQELARALSLEQGIPVDPQISIGRFPNGLRYYVRTNKLPEKRAELRLVVNAGSVLEDDDQAAVTHHARSLQPGEVVLLTLEGATPLRSASCTVFGKAFSFYPTENARVWRGVIGIDLETRAGRYSARIGASTKDGAPVETIYPLEVQGKTFPTRRMTVDERFVTPPREVEERIRREAQRTEAIFRTVTSEKAWKGPFAVPVKAPAGSGFGRRSILNGKPRSPHAGTDFSADAGAPIAAPNAGTVVLAEDLYFSGKTVIIDHGLGLYSFLAHMSEFSAHEGDNVQAGVIVGRVGATGRSTGPHLHWSVRLAGTRVDPLSLLAVLAAD